MCERAFRRVLVTGGAGFGAGMTSTYGKTPYGNFLADPQHARTVGDSARAAALTRYGLTRFLDDWGRLLQEVAT
jgi:hypothetical protein